MSADLTRDPNRPQLSAAATHVTFLFSNASTNLYCEYSLILFTKRSGCPLESSCAHARRHVAERHTAARARTHTFTSGMSAL